MKEIYRKFFDAMNQMHKVHIEELFPEMTKGEGMMLMAIEHWNEKKQDGILTVSEIAQKMHLKPSAVSRTLKSLEEQGLIERTVNQTDRRNTYVTLSEHGKETCNKMKHTMDDFTETVLSSMTEEDTLRLIAYLNELHQVAVEEIERRKSRKE